jgi:hypothetical protein
MLSREEIIQFILSGMRPTRNPFRKRTRRKFAEIFYDKYLFTPPPEVNDCVVLVDAYDRTWSFVCCAPGEYKIHEGDVRKLDTADG